VCPLAITLPSFLLVVLAVPFQFQRLAGLASRH